MYGAKITSIRLARGYTQDYIEEKLGIPQNAYSKIERDEKTKLDDILLGKIAETLGVSMDDIKSPTPIVMNFHNNPYSGQISHQNNNITENIVALLTNQLKVKDSRISQLVEQNHQLVMHLEKLNERKSE